MRKVRGPRRKRSSIRKRGRSRRTAGISPTVAIRKGAGTGHVSILRHKKATARRKKKESGPAQVREITEPGSPWKYVVHFHVNGQRYTELWPLHKVAIEFIKTSLSGQYKIVKIVPKWSQNSKKLVNYVKLEDESDLFTLMLCHRSVVRKIFKINDEEA